MMNAASIKTRFAQDYGLKHPFACAGLAFAGMTSELAVAVNKGGGIGAVGIGKMPPPYIAAVSEDIRAKTDGPFNINFITIFTGDDHIAMCELVRPDVVSFHWGHPPKDWIDRLKAAGIRVWEQVGSVEQARVALNDGVDLLIVQGTEAGGHNLGTLPLFVLLPEIRDAFHDIQLLAAGGISDGRGVAAALALGADGIWVGTRLAATPEAGIAEGYKQRLLVANGEDTVLSSLFGRDVPDFNPMRVLRNSIVEEWQDREHEAPDNPENQELLGEMEFMGMKLPLHKFSHNVPMRGATGDMDLMPLLAGQGVGLVKNLMPAAQVVETMMQEAAEIIGTLGSRII